MNTHSPNAWRRFASALLALVAVIVLIPSLLILASRAALGAGHPVPGFGSPSDIQEWFGRELSTSEVVPVVLRSLLVVGWLLWAALALSVISALVGSRPRLGHVRIPRLAMFDGFAVWVAAGLTVLSSVSPRVAFAETIPSTFAPIVHVATSAEPAPNHVASAPRIGYARVETGESIEMFAERTLGDGSRWTEIWEVGQDSVVDRATGTKWTEPWRLEGGWELKLPASTQAADAGRSEQTTDTGLAESLGESGRLVKSGDSYWTIAEDLLLAHLDRAPTPSETAALTSRLMEHNSPVFGYTDPAMIHPGDVIDVDVDIDAQRTTPQPGDWVVGDGDSYWKIAADTVKSGTGEAPTVQQTGELTALLIELNADRLGYDDPEMLHPGDVVHTVAPATAPTDPPAVQDPPTPASETDVAEPTTQPTIADDPAVPLAPPVPSTAATPTTAPVDTPREPPAPIEMTPPPVQRAVPAGTSPTVDESTTNESRAPIGVLGGITLLTAAGLATAIRKRMRKAHQRTRPGQQRSKVSTATEAALADVMYRDVSDVTWMDHELRLLAHLLGRAGRTTMTIQLVQLGDGRTIEVAFTEIPDTSPPGRWVSAADRVWRLDHPHDEEQLAAVQDAPPILPALVTLGAAEVGGQLYLNVEAYNGVNVSGDDIAVRAWLANALWEVAGEAIGEGAVIRVVGNDLPLAFALPDGVELISESTAIELLDESLLDSSAGAQASMLSRRASRWEAWPTTIMVIVGETQDDRWDVIASAPSAALMSMNRRFATGLDIEIKNGVLSVPALEITASVSQLTDIEQSTIRTVLDEIDAEPIDQPTLQFDAPAGEPIEEFDKAADDWEPPSWPVMINVLGTPAATKNGDHIKLTPQQLSALALIATRREIPAHDFKRAIWGDEDDVSAERVRDMLSVLRKKVGGLSVIPKREDGLVCAGPDLGSDVLVFDALATRARTTPDELIERLHEMLDLVTGRLFNYSSVDQTWWRWSEIAFGMTDWTAKTTTAAETLARNYLERADPAAARDIAERGLIADPLNAALTEVLMEAYANLGALEAAQRVYESHDRQLDMSDLGGASNETKLVLQRLRSHASSSVSTATEAAS